jgi:mRNA-degrading endonuclease RelE of RelBE toxin-antitoxin system
MKYEMRYDPKVERQLEELPRIIAQRIVKKLRETGETGRSIEAVKDEFYGYKVRVGDYRILIDITHNPDIIWIRYIDHRRKIYKRMRQAY